MPESQCGHDCVRTIVQGSKFPTSYCATIGVDFVRATRGGCAVVGSQRAGVVLAEDNNGGH